MGTAMTIGEHYEGFEGVRKMSDMLQDHENFRAVINKVGEEFYQQAYKRRPCRRALRFIGYSTWDEPERSRKMEYFVEGKIYYSVDFNGATYTILGDDGQMILIGCVFFEWIKDV